MKPLRKLYTNSHYPLTLRYLDKDKNPIALTGYTATLVLRKSLYGTPVVTKNAAISEADGQISFVIEPSDTADILGEDDEGTFLIGAVMESPTGQITTLFQSTIEVKENIVRT